LDSYDSSFNWIHQHLLVNPKIFYQNFIQPADMLYYFVIFHDFFIPYKHFSRVIQWDICIESKQNCWLNAITLIQNDFISIFNCLDILVHRLHINKIVQYQLIFGIFRFCEWFIFPSNPLPFIFQTKNYSILITKCCQCVIIFQWLSIIRGMVTTICATFLIKHHSIWMSLFCEYDMTFRLSNVLMQSLASESTLPSKLLKYIDSIKYFIASDCFPFHLQRLQVLFNLRTLHLITNIIWYWIIFHWIWMISVSPEFNCLYFWGR
jgi:hypothetical protein